jgi:hypothetical protein
MIALSTASFVLPQFEHVQSDYCSQYRPLDRVLVNTISNYFSPFVSRCVLYLTSPFFFLLWTTSVVSKISIENAYENGITTVCKLREETCVSKRHRLFYIFLPCKTSCKTSVNRQSGFSGRKNKRRFFR